MRHLFSRFVTDQSGATAIEYALLAAGISMAIILTVQTLGTTLNGRYDQVGTSLQNQGKP